MANEYVQVAHGEARFQFVNDTATDLEAGTMFTVTDLVVFLKSSIPGYNATPTPTNPDNVKAWEGNAHLLHHENARILECYRDAPLAQDYNFGEQVVLDGEHIGYAVPHPGPDAGYPATTPAGVQAGTEYATPTTTNPVPVVARTGDHVIRVVAIPKITP